MSWNLGGTGKAEFTKFPVGVTKIRVLDDAPYMRWVHWMQQFKRTVNCPGIECPICAIRKQQKANKEDYTYNMTRRFAINIFNLNSEQVEIMEQGIGFFEDLRDLKSDLESEGDGNKLQDAIIKVRRRGTGKDDTSYRLDVEEITTAAETGEKWSADDIINFNEMLKPHEPEQILRLVNGEEWAEVFGKKEDSEATEEQEAVEVR